jgi:hypothetical protein
VEPAKLIAKIEETLALDGTHTWPDVVDLLKAGQAQLFENESGCWITTISLYPRQKHLHVWIIAGELPGVCDLQYRVVQFARANGCSKMTSTGRPGWSRKLAQSFGWKIDKVSTSLEL